MCVVVLYQFIWFSSVFCLSGLAFWPPSPTAHEQPGTATKLVTEHAGSLVDPLGVGVGVKCLSRISSSVFFIAVSALRHSPNSNSIDSCLKVVLSKHIQTTIATQHSVLLGNASWASAMFVVNHLQNIILQRTITCQSPPVDPPHA